MANVLMANVLENPEVSVSGQTLVYATDFIGLNWMVSDRHHPVEASRTASLLPSLR